MVHGFALMVSKTPPDSNSRIPCDPLRLHFGTPMKLASSRPFCVPRPSPRQMCVVPRCTSSAFLTIFARYGCFCDAATPLRQLGCRLFVRERTCNCMPHHLTKKCRDIHRQRLGRTTLESDGYGEDGCRARRARPRNERFREPVAG